jgi:hypothetical protein
MCHIERPKSVGFATAPFAPILRACVWKLPCPLGKLHIPLQAYHVSIIFSPQPFSPPVHPLREGTMIPSAPFSLTNGSRIDRRQEHRGNPTPDRRFRGGAPDSRRRPPAGSPGATTRLGPELHPRDRESAVVVLPPATAATMTRRRGASPT